MKKKLINCVIIGGGRISLSHIPHLLSHPDVNVVGVVEPNRFSRFVLRKLFKINTFSSIESLNDVVYDSVFVLTPPNSHFSIAKDFLNLGMHVFVEKPMTLSPVESMKLLTLAKVQNVHLTCGYVYRQHPIFNELKRVLDDNVYGAPISCNISMKGNVVSSSSKVSWRNVGKGSGCLYDYGCHVIDLSIFLFGKPDSVVCLSKEELFQQGVIDKFSAKLEYNFDVLIECDWADTNVRKAGFHIEVNTKDYKITTDGQTISLVGSTCKDYSIKDLNTNVNYYLRGEEFQRQLDTFVSNIEVGVYDYSGAEHAVHTDSVILQIYEKVL